MAFAGSLGAMMVSCLHDLFARIAVNSPESTAVVSEEGAVSYAELNDRSDRTAAYLRRKGVREGMFVPLCMGRSIELIVGILGVLKAGAAYVPLDPEYPKERLRTILEEIHLAGLAELANQLHRCAADLGAKPQLASLP